MQELSAAANVSVVVGVLIGLILGLAWSVPKLSRMFHNGKSEARHRRTSDAPSARLLSDDCEDCRSEVHELCIKFAEHRREEQEAKGQLSRVLGEVRDLLREYLIEQRALRQTGDGIRIPRAGGGGSA
ncbi:MAG: hypothetical protein JXB32_24760 [Deltaproteobacteria bacterium]|nr:hypothetical protein [Deltaproteobacteria bacterium]